MTNRIIKKERAVVSERSALYLERIGISPETPLYTDSKTLRMLQYAHITTVPYENLDIIHKKPLCLDIDYLYDKIVLRRRGGYCFESNALFNSLLYELGFKTQSLFARFIRGSDESIPMRRHRIMRVFLEDGDYLADVGVGNAAPRYPVKIMEGITDEQFGEKYRFVKDNILGWVLQEYKNGSFSNCFSFTDEPTYEVDYRAASFWCENHPKSPFNKQIMVSLKTDRGRITVDGNIFKIFSGDSVTVYEMKDDEIYPMLEKHFNITLT
ncbi:MAG: arylamine N-acetyltransferase [Ruminococcaceae bacterium]|nr:arylamine N-acetyltransferase [Oscillospiraceae bacterium]